VNLIRLIFLTLLISNPLPAVQVEGVDRNNLKPVSIISLIANPQMHDGEFVQVEGFCQFGLEESTIYLSQDDAHFLNYKNGLHLQFSEKLVKQVNSRKFNQKFVLIEGIFKPEKIQPTWGTMGSLIQITRIELEHRADY